MVVYIVRLELNHEQLSNQCLNKKKKKYLLLVGSVVKRNNLKSGEKEGSNYFKTANSIIFHFKKRKKEIAVANYLHNILF